MKGFIRKWFSFAELNAILSIFLTLLLIGTYQKFDKEAMILFFMNHPRGFVAFSFVIFLGLLMTAPFQRKGWQWFSRKFPKGVRPVKLLYSTFLIAILSLALNTMLQLFNMQLSIYRTVEWLKTHQNTFLLGVTLLFFIGLIIFSTVGEIHISNLLFSNTVLLLGFIHYNKLKFRGEPFYPADFLQIQHVTDVTQMIAPFFSMQTIFLTIFFIVVIAIFVYAIPKYSITWYTRLVLFTVSLFMTMAYFQYPKTFMNQVFAKNINDIVWDQLANYNQNSALLGFVINFSSDAVVEPEHYSDERVKETTEKILKEVAEKENERQVTLEKKPHIIFIMSESFWDPTVLDTLTFNEDPIPNIRAYMENYTSGHLLTPTFGGGTANTEFEAITGFSNSFIKPGEIPYQSIVDKKTFIPSIVSLLEDENYDSVAIHPFDPVFYKRKMVYHTFGFNDFYHQDNMKHTDTLGALISDESLTNEIIHQLEKSDRPMFIHSVSMQNHFGYPPFGDPSEITIHIDGLSEETRHPLESFSEQLKRTDLATKQLINYLESIDEPAVLVFFGDHLPIITENQTVYKEVNYANVREDAFTHKEYYETPFFIYTNYEAPHQQFETISPNYLAPITFELAGKKLPPYYQFLKLVLEEVPGLKNDILLNQKGEYIEGLSNRQQELLKDYEMIQYDLLIDKQSSLPKLFKVD